VKAKSEWRYETLSSTKLALEDLRVIIATIQSTSDEKISLSDEFYDYDSIDELVEKAKKKSPKQLRIDASRIGGISLHFERHFFGGTTLSCYIRNPNGEAAFLKIKGLLAVSCG